jgi:lipopolysaccharide transport system permease protein
MAVFVVFRRVTKLPSAGAPDAILVFAALLPWQFFSNALTEASASLIGNANLISKVYFPRLLIPAGAVVTNFVDFAVTLGLLAVLMAWYHVAPGWQMLALPGLIMVMFLLSIGTGILLAALTIKYRDFRYVVPFIVQFGLFVSPIAIETSSIPQRWRFIYSMNPMAGIIDGFRWAVLGGKTSVDFLSLVESVAVTLLFLIGGLWYFRRTERSFADVI